jgi:serpin B
LIGWARRRNTDPGQDVSFPEEEKIMRRVLLSATLLALAPLAAPAQVVSKVKGDVAEVVDGNNGFALDLYSNLAAEPGNLFFSPYSISNALAMTYAGAGGNTAREMKTALHFNLEPERFHSAFGKIVRYFQAPAQKRGFQLEIANRLWGQVGLGFRPEFVKLGEEKYLAGLKEVNFRAREEARQTINAWVDKATNKKIGDLVPKGAITPNTRLVLTNAIYFKAAWDEPFGSFKKPGDFHLTADKTVAVPLMGATKFAGFFADGATLGLELPYQGADISMVVLLPKRVDGLPGLEKTLTLTNLNKMLARLENHNVEITLPKFTMTSAFPLNEVLGKMGIKDAFVDGTADFSGITSEHKLHIHYVVHKAFVNVNEAGTEAAAATGALLGTIGRPPVPVPFKADHPFLFLIRDRPTGSILFMGRVVDPR